MKATQHLTASDLMIGDWVRVNYRNKVVQVTEIVDKAIGTTAISPLSEDEFEPIPLTPEILEKNGFRWTGSGDRTMMCGTPYDFEGIRYNLYVGLGKKYIEVHAAMTEKKDERWRKVNKTYLEVCGCYVHELQHALKLCGIDKEIKL